MTLFKRICTLTALLILFAAGPSAAQQLVAGRDYNVLKTAQPTNSPDKIEVLEFFWYGCIHCYYLEEPLKSWLKRKPADVDFRYVPAIYDMASWGPLAKTFYALEAMGLSEKYHDGIFNAIHREREKALVNDPRAIADWLAKRGVDRKKFLDTYNSFATTSRAQRSLDMTRSYDIPGTPAIVVDGKYIASPSMILNADNSVNYPRFFSVVDQLIAQARKERGAKK
jgi:protein dithiol oxidoreductase (disulfide-forming)